MPLTDNANVYRVAGERFDMKKDATGNSGTTFCSSALRLVLIGCSKTKLPYTPDRRRGGRITAVEMYGGQLFRKRVEYAERRSLPWRVLSAEYGAWRPDDERKPYDETLADKSPADFAVWHAKVAYDLLHELWEQYDNGEADGPLRPGEMIVEIHAGKLYARPLANILGSLGVKVELPCEGLGIGEQLALYTSGRLAAVA